jgi:hypothetical protein
MGPLQYLIPQATLSFMTVGLCEADTALEVSPIVFTFNYRVSGVVKLKCPLFDVDISPSWVPAYHLSDPVIVKLKTPYQL